MTLEDVARLRRARQHHHDGWLRQLAAVVVVVALVGVGVVLGIVFIAGVIAFAMTRLGRRTEYLTRPE